MNRREFLTRSGAGTVAAATWPNTGTRDRQAPSTAATTASTRDVWVAAMRRLADPVLNNLANGTLKARMPIEQASGANRANVTHLEAIGRLVAGLAPWIELPADNTP